MTSRAQIGRSAERHRKLLQCMSVLAVALIAVVSPAFAEDESKAPEWALDGDVTGRFVGNSKSTSSFRQDHNIKSGGDIRLNGALEWEDNRTLELQGFGQVGERQGYFVADYDKLGEYGLKVNFSSWREYYNARTGRIPEATDGTDVDDLFIGTNDGRSIFGGGSPATDWMRAGFEFDYQPTKWVSDTRAGFQFRRVDGDQTLAKGSGVFTGALNQVYPGATGLVEFLSPAQKDIEYQALLANVGADASFGWANWQLDANYGHHEIESETAEVNLLFTPGEAPPPILAVGTEPLEAEYYLEDTELNVGNISIAVARHLTPTAYLYASGSFKGERSDPEPSQDVGALGFGRITTRVSGSSKVTRLSPSFTFGGLSEPHPRVTIRADFAVKYSTQEGRLTEFRDESTLFVGDTGRFTSKVDRDGVSGRAHVSVDVKVARRGTASFDGHVSRRTEDVESTRVISSPGRGTEIEDFETDRRRVKLIGKYQHRFRRGRTVEMGGEYAQEKYEVDINRLTDQFVLDDYEVQRFRAFGKARGRIMGKLRGEVRFEYLNERRDMDRPQADVNIFATESASGETQRESWSVVPTLYFQARNDLSLSASGSVGQLSIELIGEGQQPGNEDDLANFEYDALTGTLTVGANYNPSEDWSGSVSYSIFASDDSVDNMGHTARLGGDYRFDDTWRAYGHYGFYLYRRDGTGVDDYDAHVISLGINAQF